MALLPIEQAFQKAWGKCGQVQRFKNILIKGEKIFFSENTNILKTWVNGQLLEACLRNT